MPYCPICNGLGKVRVLKEKNYVYNECIDCNGKGIVSENELKFINYYYERKAMENVENKEKIIDVEVLSSVEA